MLNEHMPRVVRFYRDWSGLESLRMEAIVLIRIEHAAPLVSPACDDGSTEHDVEQRSLELYGLIRGHRRP